MKDGQMEKKKLHCPRLPKCKSFHRIPEYLTAASPVPNRQGWIRITKIYIYIFMYKLFFIFIFALWAKMETSPAVTNYHFLMAAMQREE